MKKVSILDGKVQIGIDYSKRGSEVIEVSDTDYNKLQSKTHYFDIDSKELVEIPVPEPVDPTEEELAEMDAKQKEQEKEAKLQEIEKALIRKQALVELGEDTAEVELKLADIKREIPVVIDKEKA